MDGMIRTGSGLAYFLCLLGCASGPRHTELRHPNGAIAGSGMVADGLQTGAWTHWSPNGARLAQGQYDRDARTGLWTHWHENGNLRMRGSYAGERQVGPWEFWSADGHKQCSGEFRDGREHGEWVFCHPSGQPRQRGCYDHGHRQLQWTEWSPDGKRLSVGSYHDDQPIGRWRRFAPDGAESLLDYPVPPGITMIIETWEDGSLRREGCRRGDKADGLWVSHHRGGAVRAMVTFREGAPTGEFASFCADGSLLARGQLAQGTPTGAWLIRGTAGLTAVDVPREPRAPWDHQWSEAEVAAQQPPMVVVARWLAELGAPPEVVPEQVAAATPALESRPAPARLEAPTDPGQWTLREQDELGMLRRYYRDGWLPRHQSISARYGSPAGNRLGKGDATLAATLVGRPLPVTSFPTADGTQLDFASLRGKRILLVLLRGFTSQVCVYCFAQTAELAPLAPRWAELDCEVVVLFPGSKSRLDAFAAACASEFGTAPPPYRMVYDADLALARALGLQGNLARPASFVIDSQGLVQHAYVAESEANVADRPSANELLQLVGKTR